MKKRYIILILIALLTFNLPVPAQETKEGAITDAILKNIRSSIVFEGETRGIMNAVSSNNIKNLVHNRTNLGKIDHHFAVKLDIKGITNQKSSGRCWLFTSLNILRQRVREKFNMSSFEFSENFSFFWDQFEKANLFLEGVIKTTNLDLKDRRVEWLFKNPISDGGVWNMAVAIIKKYGLVPKSVMPESFHSENTSAMRNILRQKLREHGIRLREMAKRGKTIDELRREKIKMLEEIYKLLVFHLGEPPEKFTWRYENKDGTLSEPMTYTPLEFFHKTVDVDLEDYVMMMNDPTRPYYKLYKIEYDRDVFEAFDWTYINLPNDVLKKFAKLSLINGEPMYFSCDVGKQLDRKNGILSVDNYDYESLYGIHFGMNKSERILTYSSGSTHGMALVGVDTSKSGRPVKWLLENSWGKGAGHNGFLTMTDRWFDEYGFRLVVHKKYVSPRVLKVRKQKPILLHPWDPMFLPVEDR